MTEETKKGPAAPGTATLTEKDRLARGIQALVDMPKWAGGPKIGSPLDGGPSFKIPETSKLGVWREANGGMQAIIAFQNGYEASVVRHSYSYGHERGLWELGVLDAKTGRLTYDTPITDDVIGYLTDEAVTDTLHRISALPARSAP